MIHAQRCIIYALIVFFSVMTLHFLLFSERIHVAFVVFAQFFTVIFGTRTACG